MTVSVMETGRDGPILRQNILVPQITLMTVSVMETGRNGPILRQGI